MNGILRTAVLLPLFASCAFAGGGPNWADDAKKNLASEGKVMTHIISWGNRIYAAATPEQVAKCPAWDGKSEPPLPVSNAIKLAHSRIGQDNPTLVRLELDNIKLQEGNSEKWIYTVEFNGEAQLDDGRTAHARFVACVMMDGTVLERQFYDPPLQQKDSPSIVGEPEITRTAGDLPPDTLALHAIERRMENIVIPEVDFRQANLLDIIDFLDHMVLEHGAGVDLNDDTRLRIRVGRHVTRQERRARLPPHALSWNDGTRDVCLVTFSARDMPLLKILGIVIEYGDLEYTIHGRVVSVNIPREPTNKPSGDYVQ